MQMPDRTIPRDQQGPQSQQLLTVLLGDYWHLRPEPIPSAALVALLALFDVSEAGARAAIQRLAKRGFLVSQRVGRMTAYAVSPMSQERVETHMRLLFRSHRWTGWDESWTVVGYALTEDQRATRNALRESLRAAGFGSAHDGFWIAPGDRRALLAEIVEGLPVPPAAEQLTVFTSARLAAEEARRLARQAFDLDGLAAAYRRFIERWERVADRVASGHGVGSAADRSGSGVLELRTSIMRDWRELRHSDPGLPESLVEDAIPSREALAVCSSVYDSTGPAAEAEFRRILSTQSPRLADLASHHTFAAYAGA